MRLIRWMFVGLLFASLGLGCSREEPQQADGVLQLKVMTFNLARDHQRADLGRVVAAIRAAGADVVGLQRAEGNAPRIAEALGWDHVDERLHIVSRFPLYRGMRDGVAIAYAEVAPGRVVALANVELPRQPYGPFAVRDGATAETVLKMEADHRMPALAPIVGALSAVAAERTPTFVLGDFAAPSHLDWTDATAKAVPAVKYPLAWPGSKLLADKGFTDSYRAVNPNPVAKPGITWTSGYPHAAPAEGETFDRIDFIYAGGPAKALDSKLVGEDAKLADLAIEGWPTDRRAVVSTFAIEPAPTPDLAIVEPSRVALGETFRVRVTMQKHQGYSVAVFSAEVADDVPAITAQPLGGDGRLTVEFGTARLKPGRYFAAVTDAAGKQTAKAEFAVVETRRRAQIHIPSNGVLPGEPLQVVWQGGADAALAWIGIYPVDEPNLAAPLARLDVSAPSRGAAVFEPGAFAKPLAPGRYEARLMRGDSYVEIASARFVVANPDAKPEVSVDPAKIRLGEPVVVRFKDAPGFERDRIGLYKAGDPDNGRYLVYLPTEGAIAGELVFDSKKYRNKLTPGEYVAKLVAGDGRKEIASARFWVTTTDGAPLVTVARPRIKAGEPIEVNWAAAPAGERTWIGVYKAGETGATQALVQRPGSASEGSVTFLATDFDAALAPGDYKIRMTRDDRTTELASTALTVLDPNAVPEVTLPKSALKAGESFQVSWKRSPGNAQDWIGIYKAGVADTHSYLMWLYTKGAIDGAVTFDKPLPPGQYVAKLLVNNGYEEVGMSAPFTVTAP